MNYIDPFIHHIHNHLNNHLNNFLMNIVIILNAYGLV